MAAPPEKTNALIAWSRALESTDMPRAIEVARQARAAALDPHDELMAGARLATALRRQGNYPEAMMIARSGLARAEERGDDRARLDLLLVFAQINGSVADYAAATEAYQKLIMLAEKLNDRYFVGRGHLGLSIIYGDTDEIAKARAEEELVVKIAVEIGHRELEADALNNLGNNLNYTGDYDRAREAHERSLALRTAANNRRGMADSLINLGEVARARGDFPAALDYTQRAFAIYQQLGLKRYQANAHLQFSAILRATRRPDEALQHLNEGFALARELKSHILFANYHKEFSLVHEAKGDSRAALEAQRLYTVENEAAFGEKSRVQIALLNARYEVDRREQELARLRASEAAREAEVRNAAVELQRARSERIELLERLLLLIAAVGIIILVLRHRGRNYHSGPDDA